jgi:hypothetical protein
MMDELDELRKLIRQVEEDAAADEMNARGRRAHARELREDLAKKEAEKAEAAKSYGTRVAERLVVNDDADREFPVGIASHDGRRGAACFRPMGSGSKQLAAENIAAAIDAARADMRDAAAKVVDAYGRSHMTVVAWAELVEKIRALK